MQAANFLLQPPTLVATSVLQNNLQSWAQMIPR